MLRKPQPPAPLQETGGSDSYTGRAKTRGRVRQHVVCILNPGDMFAPGGRVLSHQRGATSFRLLVEVLSLADGLVLVVASPHDFPHQFLSTGLNLRDSKAQG